MAYRDDEPRPDLPPERRDPAGDIHEPAVRPAGPQRTTAVWPWLLVAMALLLLVVLMWPRDRVPAEPGVADFRTPGVEPTTGEMITEPGELFGDDLQEMVGRRVSLDGVQVEESTSDRAVWISDPTGGQVLVSIDEAALWAPEARMPRSGETVNVTGIVRQAEDAGELQRQFDLNEQEASRVAETGAYVEAHRIDVERVGAPDQPDEPRIPQ